MRRKIELEILPLPPKFGKINRMEREKRDPRKQAELILSWARRHIVNPCGNTLEERLFMKKMHMEAVRDALEEPGIKETLMPEEEIELQGLLKG